MDTFILLIPVSFCPMSIYSFTEFLQFHILWKLKKQKKKKITQILSSNSRETALQQ